MDDLDAPQWADFTAPSPQIPLDDYFLRRHDKHEYRDKLDSIDFESPNIVNKKMDNSKQPLSEISYINESILQKTPKSAINAKAHKGSHCKNGKIKQTTYESVLTEAMNNLQLSKKKHVGDKSFNKSCLVESPTFKTPGKTRFTRSMCAQVISNCHEKSVKFNEEEISPDEENKENIEVIITEKPKIYDERDNDTLDDIQPLGEECMKEIEESKEKNKICIDEKEKLTDVKEHEIEHESPVTDQSFQLNLEVTASGSEHETSHLISETEPVVEKTELNKSKQLPKSKVVSSFDDINTKTTGLKKKVTTLVGTAWQRQLKRRISISNQRRLSIAKSQVANTKYVSMAEAVNKYQRTTPQRFHSTNKTTRAEHLKKMSMKLTKAQSPVLKCKSRTRPVTVMSTEDREKMELEKIRQNQIKANPVPKDILKKAAPLKRVEKKIITQPEPFNLTEIKKNKLVNQQQNLEFKKISRVPTKTVPIIISSDETGVTIKEQEVLHFGIPIDPSGCKKKNTKVKPFSFEERNRILNQKKQERLKKLQEQEEKKVKAEFHARPVPAAVKTPCNKIPPKPDSAQKPKITVTRSLSFEGRIKEVQKKKEEKIKQIQEEEKRARNFKAQKVPEFKPVLVRGRSRDNLLKKSMENLAIKPAITAHKPANGSLNKSDNSQKKSHENLIRKPLFGPKKTSPCTIPNDNLKKQPAVVPKILEPKCKLSQKSVAVFTELNTDKRAKQRKEFEEQIKRKEMEDEEMRKKEEEDRIARENAEKAELRKMTETKARPMPVFKPMQVIKSNKPLTEAQSPAWAKRKGSTH